MAEPTIVLASLSDDKLKESINSLVKHVNDKMEEMVESTNSAVKRMEDKLNSLGNLKIDSGGSADGGASKRAKAQDSETDAIEKTITARGKQIKQNQEVATSFDQLASATQKAAGKQNNNGLDAMFQQLQALKKEQRELGADWLRMNREEGGGLRTESTKKRLEELREEIAKLETAYNAMLNASRHNQPSDIRGTIKDIESQDARYKQLVQQYKEEEKASQKRAENLEKERQAQEKLRQEEEKRQQKVFKANLAGALSMSEGNIEQMINKVRRLQVFLDSDKSKGFSLLSEAESNRINNAIDRINGKLAKQDQQRVDAIRKRQEEEEKANQKRLAAIEREKAAQDKVVKSYQDSVLKAEFGRVMKMPTTNIDEVRAKFERLSTIIANIRELGILSPERIASADSEVKKLGASIQRYEKFEQERITAEQQFVIEQAKEVEQTQTLEGRIKGIAQAARERFKEEKGFVEMQSYGKNIRIFEENDPRAKGLTIEQQILQQLREEKTARDSVSQSAQQQANATQNVSNVQKEESESIKKNFRDYDSLRQAIASTLGIKSENVKLLGIESASTDNLSNRLKTLRSIYSQLGRDDRNSEMGKKLITNIQVIERQIDKVRKELSRPIDLKSAMGWSEKTLDDIAYKMQRLRSYRQGIDLTKPNAANEIKQVDEALAKLQKDSDKWMSKSQEMIKNNTALGRSWNYMKNRLAFYFTVGAGTQFIKNLIEVRSQYEMNERALGILINSAERGTQIFNELSQMALVSPYTLIELSAAAKQLTAYDIAARDVVDTTRRLADMASAVGVPIERLTYALGQIKAYGYLNSRDARMFANAGIPLVKQLSDYYTELEGKMVSTADVYDRMKKKAIDYNSVMSVITKMTDEGGKFFDFQAKMADTLKVRLANLTLAWNNMLNDMGRESQGVLTWGIGALRQLFLHWKQLDALIKDAAWILGIRTGLMFIAYAALKAGNALGITTRQMALSSVVGTRLAGVFRTLGQSIATIVKSPLTWWSLLALAAWDIFDAFMNADKATIEFNKSLRDSAKTTYEDLKKFAEQYKNVRDSLYTTQKTAIGNIYDPSTGKAAATAYANQTVGQDISASEAKKVWEAMREQIELSSHASDEYISKLLSIENVSERLRQGFQILDDIQTVSAALKEIGEDGIIVTQGWAAWWNAWQGADGLIGNVKDLQKEIQRLKDEGLNPDNNFIKALDKDYATALERFRKDLKVTTDSVLDFINLNGWSGDIGKIDEVFKQVTDKLATQGNLDPQTAFTLQREVEIARAKAAKEALEIRIADEKNALATASDEISKQQIQKNLETLEQQKRNFDKFNGENRAYWNDFTKYIKERHISELTAAYNSMTDHGKKAMDFQSKDWQKYVHDWANGYEKSHNLATDSVFKRLKNWINDANTWSVFIKMTISNEDGKSVYKQLEEYDKAADDAWKTMQRLDKRISQLRKKGAKEVEGAETGVIDLSRVSQDDRELTEALKERTQAQKDYNEAVAKGGESKKENAADRKAAKQAESELAKALKDELSTIEKVRSIYKDLTKEGMSHANAVERATRGWGETVNAINRVLQKNGLQKLDLSKFAGIENPRELVNMLQSQLNALVGRAKPSEIKELQTKIQTLSVDADKYDLTKITKGLNSELDRLKEEYELAIALDADPELGSIFADWMGIDMDNLPRTAEEYAKRYTDELNSKLKEYKADIELPNLLNITDDDLRELQKRVGTGNITQKYVDDITKGVKAVRDVFSKELTSAISNYGKLLDKYGDYVVKVRRIEEEAATERKDLVMRFGNEQQKSKGLKLHTEILEEEDPVARQKLVDDLENLTNEVSKANPVALKINASIGNSENEKLAQASFEEFQKSREWIIATGDLATLSRSALGMLIKEIEKYKKTAKNLTPKQIKAINNTLKQLKREVRKNNPFAILKDTIEDSKERMADYQSDMETVMDKIIKYEKKIGDRKPTEDEQKDLDALKQEWEELYEKMKAIGSNGWDGFMKGLSSAMDMAKQASSLFTDMFSAFGDEKVERDVNRVFSVLDKTMQGAMMGTAIAPGYGTIIGAGVGLISGLVTTFADQWSGNKAITESVQESERAVKKLVNAYKMLEDAAEQAFGASVLGAKEAIKANKELQLVELKRQLALEESRSGKNYDENKATELKGQIIDLENEIRKASKETLNDILGISSHGDFFEDMISEMIDAFKNGEDAMKVFEEKWSNMIDNMIMKTIVSQVLQNWINSLEKGAEDIISKYTQAESNEIANQKDLMANILQQNDDDLTEWIYRNDKQAFSDILKQVGVEGLAEEPNAFAGLTKKIADIYKANMQSKLDDLNAQLDKASLDATGELIDYYGRAGEDFKANYLDVILDKIKENWNFGQDSENKLSQLQQGIQGITENKAGALEAYWNANTQQQYVQSDLLREIRNLLAGGDADIQTGVQAQMLLQLQQSYQVQMSIENILQSVLNPSGRAFSVELIS